MYDIIGDTHGHYDELHALLLGMGYAYDAATHNFSHPTRKALFVGDFIDAGRQNLKVISLVQNMMASGAAKAVMGNHDYNAVHYAMEDPDRPGEFMRRHSADNAHQHSEFLNEVAGNPALYQSITDWVKTLPVYFADGDLHVVHACWDGDAIAGLKTIGAINADGTITPQGWIEGGRKGTVAFRLFETLLKGPEEHLAPGLEFTDAYGRKRTKGRIKWWNENPQTYREAYSIPPSAKFADDPYTPASPHSEATRIRDGLRSVALVAFGHYWMHGRIPTPLSDHAICVDWSVAKGGMLAAYRYDREKTFTAANFYIAPKP
ncbi:MAG: metallophosphoesterase [Micavibrio sp.]|nr:metallophosphoesterase [Micavibrio sp.]